VCILCCNALGGGKASKAVTIVVKSVVVKDQMMNIKFLENEPRVRDLVEKSQSVFAATHTTLTLFVWTG
jgi:hypothetical protein